MRRLLPVLLAVLMAVPSHAAEEVKIIASNFDVTATSYAYALYSEPKPVPTGGIVDAVAASTSITSGSTGAFAGMAVGDLITFSAAGVNTARRIVTYTDSNTIVVSASLTIAAGTVFTWRQRTSGTASTSGWFGVDGFTSGRLYVDLATLNSASIEIRPECRASGTSAAEVWTLSLTAATSPAQMYPINEVGHGCHDLRIGIKETADSSTQDLSIFFVGVR